MSKVNYFIKYFGDAAAYRLCVYMLYLLQGGRSVGRPTDRPTDLPATDTAYTHKRYI